MTQATASALVTLPVIPQKKPARTRLDAALSRLSPALAARDTARANPLAHKMRPLIRAYAADLGLSHCG